MECPSPLTEVNDLAPELGNLDSEMSSLMNIRPYRESDQQAVVDLWTEEGTGGAPHFRRRGIATQLMERLEGLLKERGCLKVNLQVRATNEEVVALYEQLGYEVEARVSMGKRLYDPENEGG